MLTTPADTKKTPPVEKKAPDKFFTQSTVIQTVEEESSLELDAIAPMSNEELLLLSEDENIFFNSFGRTSQDAFSKAGLKQGILKTRRPGRGKKRKKIRSISAQSEPVPVTEAKVDKDMPVVEIASMIGKKVSEVVLAFLKKGRAYTVNQIVPKKEILELFTDFGIAVTEEAPEKADKNFELRSISRLASNSKPDLRMPIVVVMGHVDHGKTSLLDYIRKASVAAGEAGGITQKISAYQVKTAHGDIVFIDTPGHEAFTLMRRCGAKITDIALVVIAADDGIMPQTEEALDLAKKSNAQIMIALNKVDKPGLEKNIENIKTLLSNKYNILIEEWGGDVILVPVSAKTGEGIGNLLEMIALQSEVMDLKAYRDRSARAFVLESNFQKGLGPVSTVIITEGELNRGDSFVCGRTYGKVRVMENAFGKIIDKAGPSNLVKVVGFESLTEPGEILMVQSAKDFVKRIFSSALPPSSQALILNRQSVEGSGSENASVKLILKVGTSGAVDALTKTFQKECLKNSELKKRLIISKISVGDVSCTDVVLAQNTDSEIFVFATGIEHTAAEMAAEKGVKIHSFTVIYKLLEAVQEATKQKSDQETVYKEVGRAEVIKVFVMKGRGVIAGCKVLDGRFVRNGKVVCKRNNKIIAEVEISSLQHAKKTVAEVRKGFECGFVSEKFDGWQEGDTVICLEPVKRGSISP
jgi:translation initiation factor IF-2